VETPRAKRMNNRRDRHLQQLDRMIRENKRTASWAENELSRRRERRKASRRELKICKMLAVLVASQDGQISDAQLRELKQERTDSIHMLQRRRSVKEKSITTRTNNSKFEGNEKEFYKSMEENEFKGEIPAMEEMEKFWRNIWGTRGEVNLESEWLKDMETELSNQIQFPHEVSPLTVYKWKKLLAKRKNWTSPGPDGVQNYWIKKVSSLWDLEVQYITQMMTRQLEIPVWLGEGRTVLIPKTNDLSKVEKYRPITCLNTLYKLLTCVLSEDIQDHLMKNKIWDDQQKGTRKGILGTMDNLLVDRAILEEAKQYSRNLAVAYYDYEKAYDSVPFEWQILCFKMCKINTSVIEVLKRLHAIWKTKLEIRKQLTVERSNWIRFLKGFFQGDSLSPVAFCITEIPLGWRLKKLPGYKMGKPNDRNLKVNRFYFVDDLKVLQPSEEDLIKANSIVAETSHSMGMRFGVTKCAEILYRRGKMVKGHGMKLKEGTLEALDPDRAEFYTFLGIEEADRQLDEKVKDRVIEKCFRTAEKLTELSLYERNFTRAFNTKAIAAVRYSMFLCHYSLSELKEYDVRMRKLLVDKGVRTKHESVERLYMPNCLGGRGLISFEQAYKVSKIMVAVYLCLSNDPMLRKVFNRERMKIGCNNPVREAEIAFEEIGHCLILSEKEVILDGVKCSGESKQIRSELTSKYKQWWTNVLCEEYKNKVVHSVIWQTLHAHADSFRWMRKNLTGQQVARILRVQEQMVPTKMLAKIRGKNPEETKCRLCGKEEEGVIHWLSSCEYLARAEYLKRHDQALRVLYAAVLKKYGIVEMNMAWFNIRVEKVKENEKVMVAWNMRIPTHAHVEHRWPDLRIEDKTKKAIYLVDMSCPNDSNVRSKEQEKLQNYIQLDLELRQQRPQWKIFICPIIMGTMGAFNSIEDEVHKILEDRMLARRCSEEIQKTTVMSSTQMIHRIKTKLV
jgi:hypothetical protein